MFRGSVKGTGYPLHSPVTPFTSPPVRHRVPSHFNWCLPCAVPVGSVWWMLFQEERSSKLRLRRGVGQATHTRNNPHVKCTAVHCASTLNIADTIELYWVQFSGMLGTFININTDRPASFTAADHRSRYPADCHWSTRQLLINMATHTLEHKAVTVTYSNPHIARAINI